MSGFFCGVIEGFYGRQWSWDERKFFAGYLSANGFHSYCYAPKGDKYLRSHWSKPWPDVELCELKALARHCQRQGLDFGLGLSPLELFRQYDDRGRSQLREKLDCINDIGPNTLCILFDDMPGEFPALACQQLSIIDDVLSWSSASHHIVCPTYYSFDPVLEEVFGRMPKGYLETLGEGLDPQVGVFWTGNQVISPEISLDDIQHVTQLLRRQPVIWDNYLANDGRKTADHLRLLPFEGRDSALSSACAGHIVNPMNQPYLSRYPLLTLRDSYHQGGAYDGGESLACAFADEGSLGQLLARDAPLFSRKGLLSIGENARVLLVEEYAAISHPAAREVCDWLSGGYHFDPSCLTD